MADEPVSIDEVYAEVEKRIKIAIEAQATKTTAEIKSAIDAATEGGKSKFSIIRKKA